MSRAEAVAVHSVPMSQRARITVAASPTDAQPNASTNFQFYKRQAQVAEAGRGWVDRFEQAAALARRGLPRPCHGPPHKLRASA